MAFKMKGSAFKLGNVATKSALKQGKSPLEHGTNPEQIKDKGDGKTWASRSRIYSRRI